jgi:hypothetical protein
VAQIERHSKHGDGAAVPVAKPRRLRGVAIAGGKAALSFLQPTVGSRPCASAPLPVQAKCCLPGLLRRELLGPRAHQCRVPRVPRVAGVALERIAPEEGTSVTAMDRLLGDRDDRALHDDPLPESAALINMIAMISQ